MFRLLCWKYPFLGWKCSDHLLNDEHMPYFFLSISLKTVLVKCPCSFRVDSTEINKTSLKIPNM
jgi:hypothetical protein